VSVGVSTYQWKEHGVLSAQLLYEQADSALLEAKKQGKNRVIFREPVLPGSPGDESSVRLSSDGSPPTRAGEVVSGPDGGRQPALAAELAGAVDGDEFQQAMRDLLESSVQVLIAALEAKDSETMAHSQRVSSTAVAISMEMGLPAEEIERIKLASLLHDLGQLAVPEAVLRKPGPLNAEEWEILRNHPERGAAMLQGAKSFRHLVELVRFHQESFDGTGYPDRLIGNKIPLGARIIRVADAFDALTNDRPYRPRKSLDGARVELRQMAGSVLDPEIVESFLRMLATMSPLDIYLTLWREGNSDGTLDTGYGDPQTAPNAYDIGRLSGDPGPLRVSFGTHSAESSE
jgi:HD-GYP domain-containing protein (c-di-GMP phosphodiesterase class II)